MDVCQSPKIAAEKSGIHTRVLTLYFAAGQNCRESVHGNVDFFAAGRGAIAGKRGGYEMDANGFYGDTFSG